MIVVEGAFDRLALLTGGIESYDVLALVGTTLQVDTLPLQVQSLVLALDGDASGQKATQKLAEEARIAGLAVTICAMPQDGYGKDWSERWRCVPEQEGVYPVFEAWSDGYASVEFSVVAQEKAESEERDG
jgi:hypothetical protein